MAETVSQTWELRHGECGEVCYLYSILPVAGAPVLAEHATKPDGSACAPREVVTCPKCGPIRVESLTYR